MPSKHNDIFFLNLYAFSLTGGVEKVCRNFIYALYTLFGKNRWASYSMYDSPQSFDPKYAPITNYKAFKGNKIWFILSSVYKGISSKIIILSHINLLLVAKLISIFKPRHRFILFAHGIEVWDKLPTWKGNFIRNKVEVWAVSNYTKQKMMTEHGLSPQQIQVLNNSLSPFLVLTNSFEKPHHLIERYQLDIEKPILYTLNRLSSSEKYKGYDTVIGALAKLKKQNIKFTYLLAGKADDKEKARIEGLIKAHNLSDCVKLIGYLPEEELTPHFLLSDIFIMPSKGEGFGLVFIEAAAHGCQVIGGNLDGSTDALLNGKLGQMMDPNSEAEIINAIQNVLAANHPHQPQMQQKLTVEHFGFEQYAKKVAELLN